MASVLRLPLETGPDGPSDAARARVAASFASLQEGLTADPETRGYELNIANSLWGQEGYPFRESYIKLVGTHFGGGFNHADFVGNADGERVRINKWVEGETRERIKDLIPPGGVDAITTLVLTNAVYFKGTWLTQFDERTTRDATFHGGRGDATVPMMYVKSDFRYFEDDVVQVLEMPYSGEDISMLVVLPRTESMVNLSMVESRMTAETLASWSGNLSEKEVKVYFPRFEMTWGTEDISGHLADLGIIDAFSSRADFSGMTDLRDLFIGPVFHKAFVAVNEEGTEAAAATAVVMKRLAIEHETVFRADHPFLFVIRDNDTGCVLFMGRVADLG
jgi:serpin B